MFPARLTGCRLLLPETVVVCENGNGATRFRRLDRAAFSTWLWQYSLGKLWRLREIGETHW